MQAQVFQPRCPNFPFLGSAPCLVLQTAFQIKTFDLTTSVLIAHFKRSSIQHLLNQDMKNRSQPHSLAQRTTATTHRPTSPAPSNHSQHSDSSDSGFVIVSRPQKRERQERSARREEIHKDLRIMEYSLVLASELMTELNTNEIIARNCYFGRYGTVEKVIISSKHTSYAPKSHHVQAFVTYKNELDTAFAIAALRDLRHHGFRTLKVHYGTSRYCPQFIEGKDCQHVNCYFNHRLRDNHAHKDTLKGTIEGQYERAYGIIADNLEYFVEKEYQEFKNRDKMDKEVACQCGKWKDPITFPSCKEVFQRLIDEGAIDQQEYDAAKAKIKSKHQSLRQRCTSLQTQNKENKIVEEKIETSSPVKKPQETTPLSVSSSPTTSSIPTPVLNKASKEDTFPLLPKESKEVPSSLTSSSYTQSSEQTVRPQRPKCITETLQQYIERNIIKEPDTSLVDLRPLLVERASQQRPFLGEKMGELFGYSKCQAQGLNPELDACDYLIGKIVKKTFSGNKLSRFQFASWVDRKTQDCQERKLRDIIGKKLIN